MFYTGRWVEIKELVKKLRNFDGETEGIKLANEAADKIELLQKLVEDMTNNHFVDILDFYMERCQKLEEDFTELVMQSEDICKYCKNNIKCKGKECEKYCEGIGDVDGKFPDWKWSCEDFDFGTCFLLENTPCNGCFENDARGFEWRGNT